MCRCGTPQNLKFDKISDFLPRIGGAPTNAKFGGEKLTIRRYLGLPSHAIFQIDWSMSGVELKNCKFYEFTHEIFRIYGRYRFEQLS